LTRCVTYVTHLDKYIKRRRALSMPAKNPRINVVLEDPLYKQVQFLAQKDGVSMSAKVRELLREIIETQEDIYLAKIASERESGWNDSKAIPHQDVWS
jgi:predicted DNA-binding protein